MTTVRTIPDPGFAGDDGSVAPDVEAALSGCTTTMTTLALALFDDGAAGDRVFTTLNARLGRRAGDALRACREGAHAGHYGSLVDLVRDVAELVGFVRRSVVR